MKYETQEVTYTIKEENSKYYVDAYYKLEDSLEEEIFILDKKFNFIKLPPLPAIDLVAEKKYENIQDAINAYEKFIRENY